MAFGIGKAFKKAWKKTVGRLEDNEFIKAATVGVSTGLVGLAAYGMYKQMDAQKEAAAEAAAEAKRQEILANSAPTVMDAPVEEVQEASDTTDSLASARRRRYSMGRTTRNQTLGLGGYGVGNTTFG